MGPGAVGAKRTVTEHDVPGASIIMLQPLVTIANTAEPTMLAVIAPVVDCPELVTVNVATGLTVPCSMPRKSNDGRFGERTPWESPVPARARGGRAAGRGAHGERGRLCPRRRRREADVDHAASLARDGRRAAVAARSGSRTARRRCPPSSRWGPSSGRRRRSRPETGRVALNPTVTELKLLVAGENPQRRIGQRWFPRAAAVAVPPAISAIDSVASFDPGVVGMN